MRYIDLFSGIGGFHLGLRMAGFEFSWVGFSEIDPYAIKVYEKNFPNAHNLGDITKIDGTKYKDIDLITGGFPCQDISVAGKGAGITGKRSGLWKEMFRLICELRPRYVIVENVPALLGRGLGIVLGDLSSIRFDAEWGIIPAQALGAPHRRDRIWIVAYSASINRWKKTQIRMEPEQNSLDRRKREKDTNSSLSLCKENVADTQKPDRGRSDDQEYSGGRHQEIGGCRISGSWSQYWSIEPDVGKLAYGVPDRLAKLKCLGNAVVPQVVAWIGKRLIEIAQN